ncbi:hypothetical protein IKF27_00865 [Candidatus Saccharibacteria bacterium]|nr:hypothetical protein [Candidatus Saccharibacteria bacterium]
MEINDEFLNEVGLSDMPEDKKREFLKRTQAELELKVGEEISKGLTPEQIKEFEALSDGDQRVIKKLVFEMDSDFREDKVYQTLLKQSGKETGDWQVLADYLSVRWIQKNRPDYKEIVSRETEKLKEKIRATRG